MENREKMDHREGRDHTAGDKVDRAHKEGKDCMGCMVYRWEYMDYMVGTAAWSTPVCVDCMDQGPSRSSDMDCTDLEFHTGAGMDHKGWGRRVYKDYMVYKDCMDQDRQACTDRQQLCMGCMDPDNSSVYMDPDNSTVYMDPDNSTVYMDPDNSSEGYMDHLPGSRVCTLAGKGCTDWVVVSR